MSDVSYSRQKRSMQPVVSETGNFGNVANDLCEMALKDAKAQLHPLLQNSELSRLSQRTEFLQAFKSALEKRLARLLAAWQPSVQAVFAYEATRPHSLETWDGSVHLLVKVPRLSDKVKTLGKQLDCGLVAYFSQLGWQRFKTCQSILEVQQVTPNELRHHVGYGGMFCAVYTAPVKVWPHEGQTR